MTNLRIGILGAPGSGKSKFAKSLATSIRRERRISPVLQPVKVVDGYMNNLVKNTGYAFDIFATYPQNLQILFDRWTREQEAENDCHTLISVGSLYETVLYTGLRVNSDILLKENDTAAKMQGRIIMETMGVIHSLIATHDLLLFLPYSPKVMEEKGRSYDVVVNEKLPEVVQGFNRSLIPLIGTTKQKVKNAIEAVRQVETRKAEVAALDDQSTV